MKKYTVLLPVWGSYACTVEAESPEAAEQEARDCFIGEAPLGVWESDPGNDHGISVMVDDEAEEITIYESDD